MTEEFRLQARQGPLGVRPRVGCGFCQCLVEGLLVGPEATLAQVGEHFGVRGGLAGGCVEDVPGGQLREGTLLAAVSAASRLQVDVLGITAAVGDADLVEDQLGIVDDPPQPSHLVGIGAAEQLRRLRALSGQVLHDPLGCTLHLEGRHVACRIARPVGLDQLARRRFERGDLLFQVGDGDNLGRPPLRPDLLRFSGRPWFLLPDSDSSLQAGERRALPLDRNDARDNGSRRPVAGRTLYEEHLRSSGRPRRHPSPWTCPCDLGV